MKRISHKLLISSVFASGVGMAGFVQSVSAQMPASGYSSPDTMMVMESPMGATITLGGTVVPYREVTLTAQIPGRVEFIAGAEGDSFAQNQILVTINDDNLLAKRRAALAEYNNAASRMQNARVQYSRELVHFAS